MSSVQTAWYHINNIDQVDSPALIIYPDRVKENIRKLISMVEDVQWLRPHVKTNKSIEASLYMIMGGISKFKCATIAEAEMLAMCNAKDVLLAYQPTGPKLKRFVELVRQYPETKFSCLLDNIEAARQMDEVFASNNLRVAVYLDLNVGMNRTGIVPGLEAVQLYVDSSTLKGVVPVGLHVYDGHIRDADLQKRKLDCDEAFATVEKMKNEIMGQKLPEPIIVAGGSPTFAIHCKRKNVECSPGTFIYWDQGYVELCPDQPFEPAALVITRVISKPEATKLCVDLGYKSITCENELQRRVRFLNAPELKPIGHSEEHLVVEAPNDHPYKIGDVLYGLPIHICPTVALHETAYTVENGNINGEWKVIARDRKISV